MQLSIFRVYPLTLAEYLVEIKTKIAKEKSEK